MLGKILGVGAVGLIQVGFWALVLVLVTTFAGDLFGPVSLELPKIDFGTFVVIVADFVLGYFFYASLYAALGASVSTDQEAQQAQAPIVLLLIIPVACLQLVANDPRGTAAEVLTLIPFTSPFLMPLRQLLDGATPLALGLHFVVLAGSTWMLTQLAARIFRVGILMTGKRASLSEVWRWLRHG
jgi:ABC-2 type transport system permease protein